MIKLETLLEKHPDDIDSTSGVIIEYNDKILVMKKAEGNYSTLSLLRENCIYSSGLGRSLGTGESAHVLK